MENKNIDKSTGAEKIWKDWLNGGIFEEKYDTYLAVVCHHTKLSIYGPQFCEFAETRIRLGLLSIVEHQSPNIEYCHASPIPIKYLGGDELCPIKFVEDKFSKWTCNVWLVGIKGSIEQERIGEITNKFSSDIYKDFHKSKSGKKVKPTHRRKYRIRTKYFLTNELKDD